MFKFAANIDWLFNEVPFRERFKAAADAGFEGVEFLFPYHYSIGELAELLAEHRLKNVLFNLPAGDWSSGERGIASLPGRESEFRESLDLAIEYALGLGTIRLHALAGVVTEGGDRRKHKEVYIANLCNAAKRLERHGITLLVEAINCYDFPGYLVRTQAESSEICTAVGARNVRMQVDLYHMQMTEGNLAFGLRHYYPRYAHVQIAGVPGRHEPDAGEINYPYLFGVLKELGYNDWVSCEYCPRSRTVDGLRWYESARQV